jgi:hypothetical protein
MGENARVKGGVRLAKMRILKAGWHTYIKSFLHAKIDAGYSFFELFLCFLTGATRFDN